MIKDEIYEDTVVTLGRLIEWFVEGDLSRVASHLESHYDIGKEILFLAHVCRSQQEEINELRAMIEQMK